MPETPQEFYSGAAAAEIVDMTRANLAEAVKAGRITPDASVTTKTKAQPVFYRQTLENYRHQTPEDKKPQQFYATSGAFTYCGMNQVQFDRKRKEHPITPDALLHRSTASNPQALYTRTTLNAWIKELIPSTSKPRALTFYTHDQAALFLGVAPGKLDELLKEHPLPTEVMVIDPVGPGWFETTLKEYRKQHLSQARTA